jgi:hypothetical protein
MGKPMPPLDPAVIAEVEHNVEVMGMGERIEAWWMSHHLRGPSSRTLTLALVIFTFINMYGVFAANNQLRQDARRLSADDVRLQSDELKLAAFDIAHCHDGKITNAHQAARWEAIAQAVGDLTYVSTVPKVRRHIRQIALVARQAANELRHVSEPAYCHPAVRPAKIKVIR